MFRGVFIGIDSYAAPVNRLSCCVADAMALGALFEDTLGGEVNVLTDEAAPLCGVRDALVALQSASEDDLVVVSFSGHGTEDHRLVPFDVDPDRVAETCLGLDELAHLLDAIPSTLIVILDCCFSGGFGGARVFAPTTRRSMTEDRAAVEALASGSGRVVITASGAGETAAETAEFGHGLLTYHLIAALQGGDGLATSGRISLLELCNATMRAVTDSAERLREVQHPTLYGSVDGIPSLPVLVPGARYAAAFPDRVRPPATSDWSSLEPYGIDPIVINAWATSMPGINVLQLDAINQFNVLAGRSILTVAPTGSGKTMIGELAAMHAAGGGSRAVMLLPLRALVNDKYDYMTRTYGDAVRVVRATGEHSDQVGDLLGGQFDIALLTYEKFANLMLAFPHIMRGISVVVVDEVQMLADGGRGASLELLLTLVRSGHGRIEPPQIVALSAVIGDTRGLERWIGGGLLRTELRPVPLREGVLMADGSCVWRDPDGTEERESGFIQPEFRGGSLSNKPYVIPLVRRLVEEGKKVIVFRATKGDTTGAARYLSNALGLPSADDVLESLPAGDPSASSADLREALRGGVGFHNADLDGGERAVIEDCFRDRDSSLRVIVATTTLAMGVNTPAEAVVIAGLQHPFGDAYTVAEYKNMAGRAGRPGHVEAGESFIVATSDPPPDVAWRQYVLGSPESIRSHFLSHDEPTLALRCLVALGGSVQASDLQELLENSFAIWLRREQGQPGWDSASLARAVQSLIDARLVDREPNDNLTVTDLGRYAGESGVEVQSIVQVASLLRYAPPALSGTDVVVLCQVTVELDRVPLPVHRKSRQEQARWPQTLINMGASSGLVGSLHVGGGEVLTRSKRAVAALLFASDAPLTQIEASLMQHNRGTSISGPVRAVAARTRDVVDIVCRVAEFNGIAVRNELVEDLALRLELGIPEDCVPLARVAGAQLTRGQYLSLLQRGIRSLADVQRLDSQALVSLIGEAAAAALSRLEVPDPIEVPNNE